MQSALVQSKRGSGFSSGWETSPFTLVQSHKGFLTQPDFLSGDTLSKGKNWLPSHGECAAASSIRSRSYVRLKHGGGIKELQFPWRVLGLIIITAASILNSSEDVQIFVWFLCWAAPLLTQCWFGVARATPKPLPIECGCALQASQAYMVSRS